MQRNVLKGLYALAIVLVLILSQGIYPAIAYANTFPRLAPSLSPCSEEVEPLFGFSKDLSGFFSDPDGDPLSYSLSSRAIDWLKIDEKGVVSGVPPVRVAPPVGGSVLTLPYSFQVIASDSEGATSPPLQCEVRVRQVNHAPSASPFSISRELPLESLFQEDISGFFTDDNRETLTFEKSPDFPDWLNLNPTTGILDGTPHSLNPGRGTFIFAAIAHDGREGRGVLDITMNVVTAPSNQPPQVVGCTLPNDKATEGTPYSGNIASCFNDPDGDTLTYQRGVRFPSWLTLNANTGDLSGTPTASDVNPLPVDVDVVARDSKGATSTTPLSFPIEVQATPNQPPQVVGCTLPNDKATEGTPYSGNIASCFNDPDGDTLTYQRGARFPSWLTLNANTGDLSGTPTASDVNPLPVDVDVVARDSKGATSTTPLSFPIEVQAATRAPVINNSFLNSQLSSAPTSGTPLCVDLLKATSDPNVTVEPIRATRLPASLSFRAPATILGCIDAPDGSTFTLDIIFKNSIDPTLTTTYQWQGTVTSGTTACSSPPFCR
ncbi:MAG: putative Ig domain-containing protein [Cyanobacteria bacterium SBLK]|nr:putative Ig domain-containing protein [Cyanobacteria bacterium SBLK]